jgi:hypothetical protein
MPDTLTSEIEAVNVILSTIGEAPVNTLTGTLPADVNMAVSILKEVRRKVCGQGWYFNKDREVQSSLNGSGHIVLAINVLRAELSYPMYGIQLVQRGVTLYNSFTQSYVFQQAPKLDLTYLLDWSELPEQARQYIMHRAARIFQARTVGAPELDSMATLDERLALVELKSADCDTANYNMFDNPSMAQIFRYRRRR